MQGTAVGPGRTSLAVKTKRKRPERDEVKSERLGLTVQIIRGFDPRIRGASCVAGYADQVRG